MRGMERDKAHAVVIDAVAYLEGKLIGDVPMRHMPPPNQNIGVIEQLIRQKVRSVQCCGAHLKLFMRIQKCLDLPVQPLRLQRADVFFLQLMDIFVPYGYFDFSHDFFSFKFAKNLSITIIRGGRRTVNIFCVYISLFSQSFFKKLSPGRSFAIPKLSSTVLPRSAKVLRTPRSTPSGFAAAASRGVYSLV